jgi:hypothetical protein
MPTALSVDRTRVCTYTFNNGRQCRIPLAPHHPYLCNFHARKESQLQATQTSANDIAYSVATDFISYNDLSCTLAHAISAVVNRRMTTRTASTVAYLTQNLLQSIAGAQHEYIQAYGTDAWRLKVAENFSSIRSPKYDDSDSLDQNQTPAATKRTRNEDPDEEQNEDDITDAFPTEAEIHQQDIEGEDDDTPAERDTDQNDEDDDDDAANDSETDQDDEPVAVGSAPTATKSARPTPNP